MRRWGKIVAIAAAVVVVCLVVLFSLVNADTFRPLLERELTTSLGRQVNLGKLHFAPFSGSLVADNLNIAGDPDYSQHPFLTAKQLRIGVEMRPLIFSRRLEVRSLEADQPQINLVRGANGSWNFSTIGRNAANRSGTEQKESVIPNLTVGLLAIRDGRATVENYPAPGPARVYDHVNLVVHNFSFANRVPFTLSASLPADGKVSVTGNAGPVNPNDAAMTPLDGQISIQHLDPVAAGFIDPAVGISMLADVDAHATSDGRIVRSKGTVHMQRLQLGKTSSPSPKPIDLTYAVTQNLEDKNGELNDANIHVGKVAIHIGGVYRLVPNNPWLKVRVDGQNLPIDELQALMTAAGVKLPNGAVLRGGTLTIGLGVTGPASNVVVTGPVSIQNTRLVGFDLGSKISGLAAMGGIKTGDTTAIQQLRLNLKASKAGIQVSNIDTVMPAVGQATGSGTVSPAGALNFRLVVKVATASGLGKVGVGLLTKLNGMVGSTAERAAANGVPMLVTGTASDPVITADVSGLMKRNAAVFGGKFRNNNAGELLKNFFGRKK